MILASIILLSDEISIVFLDEKVSIHSFLNKYKIKS